MSIPNTAVDPDGLRIALVIEEYLHESDRALVLSSSCHLEELLRSLLKCILHIDKRNNPVDIYHPVKWANAQGRDLLFDGDNPLSTFSAQIRLARRIGVFSAEAVSNFDIIRKIRNKFAHDSSVGALDEEVVRQQVHQLKGNLKAVVAYEPTERFVRSLFESDGTYRMPKDERTYYTASVCIMINMISVAFLRCDQAVFPESVGYESLGGSSTGSSIVVGVYPESVLKKLEEQQEATK